MKVKVNEISRLGKLSSRNTEGFVFLEVKNYSFSCKQRDRLSGSLQNINKISYLSPLQDIDFLLVSSTITYPFLKLKLCIKTNFNFKFIFYFLPALTNVQKFATKTILLCGSALSILVTVGVQINTLK